MKKIGFIDFEYVGSNEILEGHIYLCDKFEGDIVESDGKNKIFLNRYPTFITKQISKLIILF